MIPPFTMLRPPADSGQRIELLAEVGFVLIFWGMTFDMGFASQKRYRISMC